MAKKKNKVTGATTSKSKPVKAPALTAEEIDKFKARGTTTNQKSIIDNILDTNSTDNQEIKTEDNLDFKALKFKDRMRAKRQRFKENTEGMTSSEKAKYMVHYYKWHAFFIAITIFLLIYVPVTIYNNKRPVAISYAVLNSPNAYVIDTSFVDEYRDMYNMKKSYQVLATPNIILDPETYEERYAQDPTNASFTQFPTFCYQGYYDVMITNKAGLTYCSFNSLIVPLEISLDKDVYKLLSDNYGNLFTTSKNYNNEDVVYAIDVSNTDFAKNINLGYDDVYLCFYGVTERNVKNSSRLLNMVFNLNLSFEE